MYRYIISYNISTQHIDYNNIRFVRVCFFCATTRAVCWMQTSGNVVQSEWVNRIIGTYIYNNTMAWSTHTHTHARNMYIIRIIHVKFEAIRINDSPRPAVLHARDTSLKRHQSEAGAWWTLCTCCCHRPVVSCVRSETSAEVAFRAPAAARGLMTKKKYIAYFCLAQLPRIIYLPTYYPPTTVVNAFA